MSDNFKKLDSLLGFSATKRTPLGEVANEALEELKAERTEKARAEAKTVISEAIKIAEEATKAEKNFNSAKAKMDKQLGGLLARLGNQSQQTPEPVAGLRADGLSL